MKKLLNIISLVVIAVSYVAMTVCAIVFLIVNKEIISGFPFICVLATLILLLPPVGSLLLYGKHAGKAGRIAGIVITAFAVAVAITCYAILNVYFVFQPYVNTGLARRVFPYATFVYIAGIILLVFVRKDSFLSIVLSLTIVCMGLLSGGWFLFQPDHEYHDVEQADYIFVGGEDGYSTYRIPSLSVIPKSILSEKLSVDTTGDVLIALAEGRRNNADDEGSIDMVMKLSFDSGKTWSPLQTVLCYSDKSGKFGNPTPIVDNATGDFHLIYITATEDSDFREYRLFDMVGRLKNDLSFAWSEPAEITFPGQRIALCAGPGKGVCLSDGKLAFACYENYAEDEAAAFLITSADHGKTWTRSDIISKGNECDVIETTDGSLLFVCRMNDECSGLHLKQYQRFYRSTDGGLSWEEWNLSTPLRTPICQCSLGRYENKIYLTHPDCCATRANLSLSISEDGKNFRTLRLYDGPSGYSSAITTSDGDVCVLAEVGRFNYYENLVFIKVDRSVVETI
ncbi:MAG: exo-alpha-sialidase [Clostridia bacterium]|nr:exo-alpha-sialidase [Clostridia bacterium]